MHATNTFRWGMTRLATALALASVATVGAAATPQENCQAGKNQASGKYAACIAKAEKALVATGDATKYSFSLAKCEGKLVAAWGKLEAAAVAAGVSCPTVGDRPPIGDFVDACVASVAEAVSGGTLPLDVVTCHDDLAICQVESPACDADLSDCQDDLAVANGDVAACQSDLAFCDGLDEERMARTGQSTCFANDGSSIACAGSGEDGDLMGGAVRGDVDNGDGTITDRLTGLMWEKLSDDGSIHDKDNQYTGLAGAIGKVTTLNSTVFAGYADWRLPSRRELESIINLGMFNPAVPPIFNTNCTASCTVLTCSCVKNHVYWSSTAYRYAPANVWVINSTDGDVYAVDRATNNYYARAVRSVY